MRTRNKSKKLIFPLSFLLLFSLVSSFSFGAGNGSGSMSIVPSQQVVYFGENFSVDVVINASDALVAQCWIGFDPSLVEAVKVENGGAFSNFVNGTIDNVNGVIKNIMGYSLSPITNNVFARITFRAKNTIGTSPINLLSGYAIINDYNAITYNGTVDIRNRPVNISIEPNYVLVGNETACVNVTLDPNGNEIAVTTLNITFDPTVLLAIDVTNGGLFNTLISSIDNDTGNIELFATQTPLVAIKDSGTIAKIYFRPISTGLSDIGIKDVEIIENSTGERLYYSLYNGSIEADLTPPSLLFKIGSPSYGDWITPLTPIYINATDEHDFVIYYRIWNGSWQDWNNSINANVTIFLTDEGIHYIEYYAKDGLNNTTPTYNETIYVDATAPVSSIEVGKPSYEEYINSSTMIYINATDASGIKEIHYKIDGGNEHIILSNSVNFTLMGYGEGNHSIEYWAVDNVGNEENHHISTYYVDDTPPGTILSTTGALGNNGWYVSNVNITLNAIDNGSGVNATYYRIDANPWQEYNQTISITTDGTHTIEYYSVDNLGNTESMKNITVKIDKTLPEISYVLNPSSPNGNNGWYVSNVDLTFSVNDETSGIAEFNYRIDANPWQEYNQTISITTDGTHTIEYYCIDNAGNNASGSITVKIDKTLPEISYVLNPSSPNGNNGWYVSNVDLTFSVNDETSGIAEFNYRIDANPWQEYNQTISITTDGTHTIEYYCIDNAGNNASGSITVKIDKTPPHSSHALDGTYSNGKYTSDVTVRITAQDAASGVKEIHYRLDGGAWQIFSGSTATDVISSEATHTVEYYSVDNAGNIESQHTVTFTIEKNKPPVANFSYTPSSPYDTDTITFVSHSKDIDGTIKYYIWDFGDGKVIEGENASSAKHKYADNGTYVVKLTVKDDKGATDTIQKAITVMNKPPIADFTHIPKSPKVGDVITFKSVSVDEDGNIVNYTWDFGDGSIAYGKIVNHSYDKKGNYTVKLTVKDNDGAVVVKTESIVIRKEVMNIWLPLTVIIILIIIAIALVAVWKRRTKS